MMADDIETVIIRELDRWQTAGRTARFWLRDDDAVAPSAALDHLLETAADFSVPITLAVIPASTDTALARRLEKAPLVTVAVHGWSHRNHAAPQDKKQELGPHRSQDAVLGELADGFCRLADLHAGRFVPVLVPPWNRIDAALVPQLAGLGYRALSVYGPERPAALPLVNTHVDVIDWTVTRAGQEPMLLAGQIVSRLRQMADHGGAMGLLTHHLVHDDRVRDFLKALFSATVSHPACVWTPIAELMPALDDHERPADGLI